MGGGEIWLADLCARMNRSAFEPHVALPRHEGGELARTLLAQKTAIHQMPMPHLVTRPPWEAARSALGVVVAGLRLFRLTKRLDATLIHASCLEAGQSAVIAAKLARVPSIVSVLNSGPPIREGTIVLRLVDTVVVNARHIRSDIRSAGVRTPIEVIHLGTDVRRLADASGAAVRAELGLGGSDAVVSMVGNVEHRKGYDILVRAAAQVAKRFPDVRFLAIGGDKSPDGAETARLRNLARALGVARNVVFTGPRRDVPELLAASDVFVLCSRSEGLSLAMTEAMAAGKPVIVTPVGGMAEDVEPGKNGLLVPPEDPAALAEKIQYLLAHPGEARALGRRGQEIARRDFDTDALVQRTEAVYRKLLRSA